MSVGNQKRSRTSRVSPLKLPPGLVERAWSTLRRGDVLARLGMCLAAAAVIWLITGLWNPPFPFREGDIPTRDVVARVEFETIDETATRNARDDAIAMVRSVHRNDASMIDQLIGALKDEAFGLILAESYGQVNKKAWAKFSTLGIQKPAPARAHEMAQALADASLRLNGVPGQPAPPSPSFALIERAAEFDRFKANFADEQKVKRFEEALERCLSPFRTNGLLETLDPAVGRASQTQIRVFQTGHPDYSRVVEVNDVRIAKAKPRLETSLKKDLSPEFGQQLFNWLRERLPKTLTYESELTQRAKDALVVAPVMTTKLPGDVIASADKPIIDVRSLLQKEHSEYKNQLSPYQRLAYSLAKFGMYVAIFTLCGFYLHFRRQPLISDFHGLAKLLVVVSFAMGVTWFAAPTRFELIPLLLFSMTAVIVHKQELAVLFSVCMAFAVVMTCGFGIGDLVTLVASMSSTVLFLQHVRSRTKLIYVGLWVALVTFLTSLGSALVAGDQLDLNLVRHASWAAGCCGAAGLLMTGLLPFIEKFFDVQTDLSLLELGDVAHPLLQELVRRAPGTYNHSINVASIAQAAAEAIDANGQLVRVGAYFHDIGKMLKPQYFVENQTGNNRHESLMPAMSTLVIIAHVKDGADLARQHNLPNSVIDFIQQHHGTTLVEYFYHRANEQERENDPDAKDVDEGNYRYPGPKPQTKEAAVLMLSDAVESAARALVDPAPARIESLVEELAMKRLLDGQFDECGLTLEDLYAIQFSLMKSMTAVYHGRIKYPDQQSA